MLLSWLVLLLLHLLLHYLFCLLFSFLPFQSFISLLAFFFLNLSFSLASCFFFPGFLTYFFSDPFLQTSLRVLVVLDLPLVVLDLPSSGS